MHNTVTCSYNSAPTVDSNVVSLDWFRWVLTHTWSQGNVVVLKHTLLNRTSAVFYGVSLLMFCTRLRRSVQKSKALVAWRRLTKEIKPWRWEVLLWILCIWVVVLSVSLPSFLLFPPGEAWAGGEWHQPHRRGAGDHVSAGAEPAPPRALQRRDPATETTAAHPEEPGLRRQLPGEASHPEGGAGEAEGPAAAGGGQTGQWECFDARWAGRSEV